MTKVIKTSFEEEQKMKEDAWMLLTPQRRLEIAFRISEMTRRPGVNYSFKGMKVKISRPA